MYGTSPCCKAILGYRKLYKGLVIHASREIEARQVYIAQYVNLNKHPVPAPPSSHLVYAPPSSHLV